MIRIALALVVLAIGGAVQAQPAPRVTLDISLPASDGFELDPFAASKGRLAVGGDGTLYLLLYESKPLPDASTTTTEARIDLLALAPDGAVKRRRTLPAGHGIGQKEFNLNAMGVVETPSRDLAVFISTTDPAMTRAERFTDATLFRLGSDFQLKKTAAIGPPSAAGRRDSVSFYEPAIYLPTLDNALMLAGGFGPGPLVWWIGKYGLDGTRFWQDRGHGIPEGTAAIAHRPDGTWLSVVREMAKGPSGLVLAVRRYTADGKVLARTPLPQIQSSAAVAILPDGIAFITSAGEAGEHAELIVVDDSGRRVLRRAPWPFAATSSVIADGAGLFAIVADGNTSADRGYIARADGQGTLRWRSAPIEATTIVRTPDGQVTALSDAGKERKALRLVRFADP